jgi:hypothetical protein
MQQAGNKMGSPVKQPPSTCMNHCLLSFVID